MKLEEQIRQAIRDVKDYPKPGIIFKDITPVLAQPYLVKDIIANIVERYKGERIDAIAAVEARGFILGSILATELNCAFVPIRKSGKLPFRTLSQDYALEYGSASVEMHEDAVKAGWRVMVHDDLLATGGTAGAAASLVNSLGANVAGFSFLIELTFLYGRKSLKNKFGVDPYSLVSY
jgi:adenine phosphoribosyltransferase